MSVLSYRLLARFRVQHAYFADGLARQICFLPDAPTQRWLKDYELLCRSNGHSLSVHLPEHRSADLFAAALRQPERARLGFALRCSDAEFPLYSADTLLPSLTVSFEVTEGASLPDWLASLGRSAELKLRARRTQWKYLLLGDWREHQPRIVDPSGRLSFEAAPAETLSDGRQALVFRAQSELPLAQLGQPQLQLCDGSTEPPRVLVSRLPGAAPRGLQRETLQGERRDVSEIFVSR